MSLADWLPFRRKDNPVANLIVLGLTAGSGTPIPPKRNFATQADQGYQQNVTVYSCVNLLARACAGVPWVLMQGGTLGGTKGARPKKIMTFRTASKAAGAAWSRKATEEAEIQDHPLLKLIEKPNPLQGGPQYTESVFGFYLISGNCFETWVTPDTGPNKGRPMELWTLRPDRTRIVPAPANSGHVIASYEYRAGTMAQRFDVAVVLHQKFFSPTDDFYGLSPIQVASRVIDGDNQALEWNYHLLKNDARPPSALIVRGMMQGDARDQLKKDLEERYSGSKNARRPMVLEGDVDWKTLAVNPADLDWMQGRKLNAREIAKVYGVPSEFVDMDQVSYASKQEARRGLYHETILPLLDRRRDDLNNAITPLFGDGLFLDYDRDQIEALRDDTVKLYVALQGAQFLTFNEKRQAAGYDQYTGDPGADEPQDVPVGLLPAERLTISVPPNGTETRAIDEAEGGLPPGVKAALDKFGAELERKTTALLRKEGRAMAAHLERQLS
jgi:HK97 family phage portal protein